MRRRYERAKKTEDATSSGEKNISVIVHRSESKFVRRARKEHNTFYTSFN